MSDTPRDRLELMRLIAQQLGGSPPLDFTHKQQWLLKRAEDILDALEDVGCAVVPGEATKEMISAGYHNWSSDIWDAMIALSPYRAP